MACLTQATHRRQSSTHEITHRLVRLIRNPYRGQLSSSMQRSKFACITPVGLDPLARLAWDQRWSDHHTRVKAGRVVVGCRSRMDRPRSRTGARRAGWRTAPFPANCPHVGAVERPPAGIKGVPSRYHFRCLYVDGGQIIRWQSEATPRGEMDRSEPIPDFTEVTLKRAVDVQGVQMPAGAHGVVMAAYAGQACSGVRAQRYLEGRCSDRRRKATRSRAAALTDINVNDACSGGDPQRSEAVNTDYNFTHRTPLCVFDPSCQFRHGQRPAGLT